MGLQKKLNVSTDRVVRTVDLVEFLSRNMKHLPNDMKRTFQSVTNEHNQTLLELEKYGLVEYHDRGNTVSLCVTNVTLDDIDKYLSKNESFSKYISWKKALSKSHN